MRELSSIAQNCNNIVQVTQELNISLNIPWQTTTIIITKTVQFGILVDRHTGMQPNIA